MKSITHEPETTTLPKGYRNYKIKGLENTIIAKNGGPTAEQVKKKPSYPRPEPPEPVVWI